MTTSPDVKHLFNEEQITSANVYFEADIDGESVKIQLTARFGSSPQLVADQAKALIEGYRLARQAYPRPSRPASVATPESEPAKKFEKKPAENLPEGLPDGIIAFKEDFDEIEVTPQADNKVTVAFLRDGMKYPVGAKMNKWKNENAAKSLVALGEFDLTKAAKIRVAGTQYYSEGNEFTNQKGEKSHYKDLRLIEARF